MHTPIGTGIPTPLFWYVELGNSKYVCQDTYFHFKVEKGERTKRYKKNRTAAAISCNFIGIGGNQLCHCGDQETQEYPLFDLRVHVTILY